MTELIHAVMYTLLLIQKSPASVYLHFWPGLGGSWTCVLLVYLHHTGVNSYLGGSHPCCENSEVLTIPGS